MNDKKQLLLLELLVASPDTFALCQGILKAEYFVPELRNAVEFVLAYYDDYHTTPATKLIEAESGVELEETHVQPDEVKYCASEIETFCKERAFMLALVEASKLAKEDKKAEAVTLMQEALEVSLNSDLGLRYFDTVEERLARMMKDDPVMPTGWDEIDEALFGGIARKELLLVAANSGGGKSITLACLAVQMAEMKRNVLVISLELAQDTVAQRFDSMFTGIGRKVWKDNVPEIIQGVANVKNHCGELDIKYMPQGSNAAQIRAFLKEYYLAYGYYPDLLVVDYMDEMSPMEKVSADNVFEKDKRIASQIRQVGVDFDMAVATASQLNRGAVDNSDHNHSHIAGGISKIHLADVFWTIIMDDIMKAKGECIFKLQKTRNSDGVGKTFFMGWVAKTLRIVNGDGSRPPEVITPDIETHIDTKPATKPSGGLVDIMFDDD